MSKRIGLAAAAGVIALAAAYSFSATVRVYVSWRALLFVTLYTAILVAARYSPGRCLHRISVAGDPSRHLPLEVMKAREFVSYVCTRLLFAGLIFTLADIAGVLAANKDVVCAAGTLSMALSASLYSLVLYLVVSRAGRKVLEFSR